MVDECYEKEEEVHEDRFDVDRNDDVVMVLILIINLTIMIVVLIMIFDKDGHFVIINR